MSVIRLFLRNTQTVTGTGGNVYDLSTVQGTATTLASGNANQTTFLEVIAWRFELGAALPDANASVPVQVSVSSISANAEMRWRLQQVRGGTVLASTGYSTERTSAGTYNDTLSFSGASWQSGDLLQLAGEVRRTGGGGNRSFTTDVNSANSYIDPTLIADYVFGVNAGTFALEGQAAELLVAARIATEADDPITTEAGVDLVTENFEAIGFTLDAEAGSFALAGQDAGLLRGVNLIAEVGSFTLSGQAVALTRGAKLQAEAGSFTLTGQAINFLTDDDVVFPVDPGSFALAGQDVAFKRGYVFGVLPGSFTLAGQEAAFDLGAFLFRGRRDRVVVGISQRVVLPQNPNVIVAVNISRTVAAGKEV